MLHGVPNGVRSGNSVGPTVYQTVYGVGTVYGVRTVYGVGCRWVKISPRPRLCLGLRLIFTQSEA